MNRIKHEQIDNCKDHMTGARHELLAACYYLQNGFNVFWPTCQQTAVDFVVETSGGLKRVQVKTAYMDRAYLRCRIDKATSIRSRNSKRFYDILFVVGLSEDGSKTSFWEIPTRRVIGGTIQLLSKSKLPRGQNYDAFRVHNMFHAPHNYKNENN